MVLPKKKKNGTDRMTNEKMLNILMQEIADVRGELKQDIGFVRSEQQSIRNDMKEGFATVQSELSALRTETHRNQATFIKNHADLERRVSKLAMAA